MAAKRGQAREAILTQAEALVKQRGAEEVSVEAVAAAAGSAKGLVHYHFKTKQGLMGAVAERMAARRADDWTAAFNAPTAQEAVHRTWKLLTEESASGTTRAWQSLVGSPDRLPDGSARNLSAAFVDNLSTALNQLLRNKLALKSTVPSGEIGQLFGAVVDGMGRHLMSGADEAQLEGAFAAAWLGVLSLTQSASIDGADVS